MKFLIDENVRKRLVKVLKQAGHNVKIAEKGAKNSVLFLLAKQEKRILLTNDTDFLDKQILPHEIVGIIVFRIFPDTFDNQKDALLKLLEKFEDSRFAGKIIELKNETHNRQLENETVPKRRDRAGSKGQ